MYQSLNSKFLAFNRKIFFGLDKLNDFLLVVYIIKRLKCKIGLFEFD